MKKQMRQKLISCWAVLVFIILSVMTACGGSTTAPNSTTVTSTPAIITQPVSILTSQTSTPTQNPTIVSTTSETTTQSTSATYAPTVTPYLPSFVVIAASDSSSQWKSLSTIICDGTSDQLKINTYLQAGNTIELAPGTFSCNGTIKPQTNTHLYGQGDTTVIDFAGGGIYVNNGDDIELDHFKITGTTNPKIVPAFLFIEATNGNHYGFSIHDIEAEKGGFLVYTFGHQITNVVFANCNSLSPIGTGFSMYAQGTDTLMQDFIFYNCSVENAGIAQKGADNWSTGFDFAEGDSNMTINRLTVIKCSVNGAWESDFHFEGTPTETGIVILDCDAKNAGQKPSPTYGFGYLLPSRPESEYIFEGNTGGNNYGKGDVYDAEAPNIHTLPYDEVYGSNKMAYRISQDNCTGLLVTNGNYMDLYLYSTNSNPVKQQIELGSVYAANDGKTYTFSGNGIIVQFTNFAIIRLVNRSTSQ